MKRIAWMTDIHLNFLGTQQIESFLNELAKTHVNALIISGDIGEAPSLQDYLGRIADHLYIPIYFVLGNHDYYRGSIGRVRDGVRRLTQDISNLIWLPEAGLVRLSSTVALVGHGGWSDGGYGDFMMSDISLNDYAMIQELAGLSKETRFKKLQSLGQEGADYLRRTLSLALAHYGQVYVVTHSPPFQEACWYEGQLPDNDNPYLPHFTCKAIGDVLLDLAVQYPTSQMIVLCGHVHHGGMVRVRDNLLVMTAGAEYEHPRIERILELP